MMAAALRIILVDDHEVMREGLVALLSEESGIEVIGQAGNGRDALALVSQDDPDVILLDITMPDMDGLEVARRLGNEGKDTRILILTMHEEEAFFFEALRAGASGYILKGARSDELINAIRIVGAGDVYLPPQLAGGLVKDFLANQPLEVEEDPLTPRELEILSLIAQGLSNRAIADSLMLSINTVKSHRLHIYQKLNLHDRAGLINYALKRGLI